MPVADRYPAQWAAHASHSPPMVLATPLTATSATGCQDDGYSGCSDMLSVFPSGSLNLKTAADFSGRPQALESIEFAPASHFTNLVTTAVSVTACRLRIRFNAVRIRGPSPPW